MAQQHSPSSPIDTPTDPAASYLQPRTPSFDGTVHSTPAFSSPDTPWAHDPGPSRLHARKGSPLVFGTDMHGREEGEEEGDKTITGIGLGLVDDEARSGQASDTVPGGKEKEVDQTSYDLAASSTKPGQIEVESEDEESADAPSQQDMDALRAKLDGMEGERTGDGWAQRDELARMVRQLLSVNLDRMPVLQQQVDAQSETIRIMQHQAKISRAMLRVERDRHSAERKGWRAELKALEKIRQDEIAAGTRPRTTLQIDVGYQQELEASNKRLEMDNRLMAPRLADTNRQIEKLVTELRYLRSQVILSNPSLDPAVDEPGSTDAAAEASSTQRRKPISPAKPTGPTATMGDARAEHLLLAARRVRSMRAKDDRVGKVTLSELQKGGVVGPEGGVGYAEGYGETIEEEDEEDDEEYSSEEDIKPVFQSTGRRESTASRAQPRVNGTPLLPRAKRSSKRSLPPPTTPRTKNNRPQTTPGGSNFDELLRAAEMATRPGTPTPPNVAPAAAMSIHGSAMSATRSTTRPRGDSGSERGSPVKRARRQGPPLWGEELRPAGEATSGISQRTDGSPDEESALDILAQASQLEAVQSQDSPESTPVARSSGLAPAITLRDASADFNEPSVNAAPTYVAPAIDDATTPKSRNRALSNASEIRTPARGPLAYEETPMSQRPHSPPSSVSRLDEPPPGAYASPTGAAVPGLGKYVHLTSSLPARRVRSPYLKWTSEEDELLARAVAIHGEKWDLVSKGVPTRSYHQVRQRWLRRTGAFDKKPPAPSMQMKEEVMDEDEDGSPTPTPGGGAVSKTPIGKKRKASVGQ